MPEVFEALCATAMAKAGTHMAEVAEALRATALPEVSEVLCATAMAKAGKHMPEVFEALLSTHLAHA